MRIRDAAAADLPGILDITNHVIRNTTAVWTWAPATLEARAAWMRERHSQGYPVLVAEAAGAMAGFASFGDFRAWDGYRHTAEHSIYVAEGYRRQGVGAALLEALVARAMAAGKHVLVAGIEAENRASIRLHERCGFEHAGRLRQVGWKFDRWLDLAFMQRLLDPPDRRRPD